jgi:large subunit ribosomal protein L21
MSYAIIKAGGKQFRVSQGDTIAINRLTAEAGATTQFDQVLCHGEGKDLTVGSPTIPGAVVEGQVIEHFRGEKVVAFKYRRRKGYSRKVGHRQELSRVKITGITIPNA